MPVYEYQCLPERHIFEVRQGIHDDPVTTCSVCGGPVRRVIQPVGVVFKGSGFYVNDSRKSTSTVQPAPNGKAGETTSDGQKDSKESKEPGAEAKTDAKPSAAPEGKAEPAPAS